MLQISIISCSYSVWRSLRRSQVTSSKSIVDLSNQSNYVCLNHLKDHIVLDRTPENAQFVNQRSNNWRILEKKVKSQEGHFSGHLGLGTLKDQQEHHAKAKEKYRGMFETQRSGNKTSSGEIPKVYLNKCSEVSDGLRFDWGTDNEGNALATLFGKILPGYFPG